MYEKYSTRGVSRGKYSTWPHLVLYLPLDTPPHAVFSVHICGGALTIQNNDTCIICRAQVNSNKMFTMNCVLHDLATNM